MHMYRVYLPVLYGVSAWVLTRPTTVDSNVRELRKL
jgi:hypothetical protein